MEIADAREPPPLYMRPTPIADDMSPAMRAYVEYWNSYLEEREASAQANTEEMLRAAGVPSERLLEPHDPAVAALLESLHTGRLAAEFFRDTQLPKRDGPVRRRAPAHVRVLAGARLINDWSAKRTADYLNQHKSNSAGEGLQRDHVIRGTRAFTKALIGRPSIVAECEYHLTFNGFIALDYLRREALQHPQLKRFLGAELAEEMHTRFNLPRVIEKAMTTLGRKGGLLPIEFGAERACAKST